MEFHQIDETLCQLATQAMLHRDILSQFADEDLLRITKVCLKMQKRMRSTALKASVKQALIE